MSAETKEDILREMRMGNSGDMPFAYQVGMPDTFEEFPSGTKMRKINIKQVTVKELADRFEAAFKRESVGNVAAMRSALSCIRYICAEWIKHGTVHEGTFSDFIKEIDAAFAEPERNCDLCNGDYYRLHKMWFDWTGTTEGQNPDGTVKLTYGEWLLAVARKKVEVAK